jgi:AhpC/TSA family
MRGQHARIVGWGLAVFFGILLASPWLANGAPGAEIKLPPLRVQVGEKAPDFALPAAGGKTIRLSDFSGHKILIDFYRGYW